MQSEDNIQEKRREKEDTMYREHLLLRFHRIYREIYFQLERNCVSIERYLLQFVQLYTL